jgi:ribosomal protein S18 acetylase RimI-like enzyme
MAKSIAFITDVAIRCLEGASATELDGYLVVRTPANPGFWWGNFLLLDAVPEDGSLGLWMDRFAAEFPEAKHVTFGIDTLDAEAAIPAEFIEAGLEPDRSIALTAADVTEPAHVNSEVEIRALASDDDWRQSAELGMRLFTTDLDYYLGRARARRRIIEQGLGVWFGAFEDGALVAQLGLFRTGDGLARYQDVETDPALRRRGLAGTLVWQAGRYGVEELGAHTLVIVADKDGDAIRLYRSVGFTDAEGQLGLCRPPAAGE